MVKLNSRLSFDEVILLVHDSLKTKENIKRIYGFLKNKKEKQNTLGYFYPIIDCEDWYDNVGKITKIHPNSAMSLLIDTNTIEFADSLAKMRLIYDNYSSVTKVDYNIYFFVFPRVFALLDNGDILKTDFSRNGRNVLHKFEDIFNPKEKISAYNYGWDLFWENTEKNLEEFIEEKVYPQLKPMFNNLAPSISYVENIDFPRTHAAIGGKSIAEFPISNPEKLEVKPEFKEKYDEYCGFYSLEENLENFRIHEK